MSPTVGLDPASDWLARASAKLAFAMGWTEENAKAYILRLIQDMSNQAIFGYDYAAAQLGRLEGSEMRLAMKSRMGPEPTDGSGPSNRSERRAKAAKDRSRRPQRKRRY